MKRGDPEIDSCAADVIAITPQSAAQLRIAELSQQFNFASRPAARWSAQPSTEQTIPIPAPQPVVRSPEEIKELLGKLPSEFKAEIEYHMELVRADTEVVLWKLKDNLLEPGDLEDCITELRFATKKIETLKSFLETTDLKQAQTQN